MLVSELLEHPASWTKGALARNIFGDSMLGLGDDAVSFCLYGAINRCYLGKSNYENVVKTVEAVVDNIIIWNDDPDRKYGEVVALAQRLGI